MSYHPCVLCVFVFFFNNVYFDPSSVFCVFLCFFTNVEFDPSSDWGNHSIFYVFLCFIPRAQVTQPMCSVSFCVFFYQRLVWLYFRPGQPPNIFYVFLCFSPLVSGHTTHVFRVFLWVFFYQCLVWSLIRLGHPPKVYISQQNISWDLSWLWWRKETSQIKDPTAPATWNLEK